MMYIHVHDLVRNSLKYAGITITRQILIQILDSHVCSLCLYVDYMISCTTFFLGILSLWQVSVIEAAAAQAQVIHSAGLPAPPAAIPATNSTPLLPFNSPARKKKKLKQVNLMLPFFKSVQFFTLFIHKYYLIGV